MEDLIVHAPLLFDDPPTQQEPPLPPAPSGEPKPKYDYGSAYTQITTLPPRSQGGQDFTPTLPPRPGQSIHPSRRTNQQPSMAQDVFNEDAPPIPPSAVISSLANPPASFEAQPPAPPLSMRPQSQRLEVCVTPSATIVAEEASATPMELGDTNAKEDDPCEALAEFPSPKTPDTFATAVTSPHDSPQTPKTSRPPSRLSAGHGESPADCAGPPEAGVAKDQDAI